MTCRCGSPRAWRSVSSRHDFGPSRRRRRRGYHPHAVIGYGVPIALAGTLSLLISARTNIVGMMRHWRAGGAFADAAISRFVILPLALGALFGAPLGALLTACAAAALITTTLGSLLIWSAWKVFGKHA